MWVRPSSKKKKKKTDVDHSYHKIPTAVLAEWKYFSKEI